MATGLKLSIGAAIVIGGTAYMAYVGAAASWQYYLTVDECLADTSQFVGQRVRVSGTIVPASLQIDARRTQATFAMRGGDGNLPVTCSGSLPDNLSEGLEVVVEGRVDTDGRLLGEKVLTKCASKYERGERPAAAASRPATTEETP